MPDRTKGISSGTDSDEPVTVTLTEWTSLICRAWTMTLAVPTSVRVGFVQLTEVATAAAPSANALSQKWSIGYTSLKPAFSRAAVG